jgi:AcrR family transcriptional regulator
VSVLKGQGRRGPRGPYAKSSTTQTSILDSALTVFANSGYNNGSLRDIAAGIGLTDAALLHHFKNKSNLLAALLQRRDEQTREHFDLDPKRGLGLLRDTVELVRLNASTPGVIELFCTLSAEATSPDHPAHRYFIERYANTRAMLQQSFQEIESQGQLRIGLTPAEAARGTVAFMDGIQIQWLLDHESVDMVADVEKYLRSLVTSDF